MITHRRRGRRPRQRHRQGLRRHGGRSRGYHERHCLPLPSVSVSSTRAGYAVHCAGELDQNAIPITLMMPTVVLANHRLKGTPLRRSLSAVSVPCSSAAISRLYPTTSAATICGKATPCPFLSHRSALADRCWRQCMPRTSGVSTRFVALCKGDVSDAFRRESKLPGGVRMANSKEVASATNQRSARQRRLPAIRSGKARKRSGVTCRAPAVKGKHVCRMHGARAGAPQGPAHGRYVHGVELGRRRPHARRSATLFGRRGNSRRWFEVLAPPPGLSVTQISPDISLGEIAL